MIGFSSNMLLPTPTAGTGAKPCAKTLECSVYADLIKTPTAKLAEAVLPVASYFEREALFTILHRSFAPTCGS